MSSPARTDRPLTLDTPLGPEALLVTRMEGDEGLSRLFRFRLHLLARRQGAPASVVVPIERLLGQPVAVHLRGRHATRHVHGIVASFVRVENPRDKEFFHFDAELVPAFWLSTRRVRSRIFQRQSVPDILRTVLGELRPDVEINLQATYPQREYCVQYRESDFAFASRLMEDEGISYYFRHEAERHVLVLVDHPTAYKDLPEHRDLRFQNTDQPPPGEERLTSWETMRQVQVQAFARRDQHFELSDTEPGRPLRVLHAEKKVEGEVALGRVKVPLTVPPLRPNAEPLEAFEHNTGFSHRFEGAAGANNLGDIYDQQYRQVSLRREEEDAGAIRIDAQSSYAHAAPGCKFALSGLEEIDGPYLFTSVAHVATQGGFRSGEEGTFTYENRLTCVPEGLPVRPARITPRPRIDGVQTAIVTGAAGKAVDVDAFGRVKVQFHWDRRDRYDQDSSCWVRTGQMWAGNRWGSFFWLRPGMEAIVAFEDGDPDRPFITGTAYNQANQPPFALPEVSAAGGIVSCTLGGDPQHESSSIIFHDQPGDEHVQIHSQTHEVHTNEAWRLTHAPGGHIEFAGTLDLGVGSGAGGGLAGWASSCGVQPDTSGSFTQKLLALTPGKTSFVCGLNESITLGSRCSQVLVNSDVKFVSSYLAMLMTAASEAAGGIGGLFGPLGTTLADIGTTAISWIWNEGPSLSGDAVVTNGPKTGQVYFGPKIDITRCPSYAYKTDLFSPKEWKGQDASEIVASIVVGILDVALNAAMLALDIMTQKRGQLSSSYVPDPTVASFTQKTTSSSAWGAVGTSSNWWAEAYAALMLKVDTCGAVIQAAKTKAKTERAALEAARGLASPDHGESTIAARLGDIQGDISSARIGINQRIGDLRNMLAALTGAAIVKNGGMESINCQLGFSVGAPRITIAAAAANERHAESNLTLSSLGEGVHAERKTGCLTAKATKCVDMSLVGSGVAEVEAKVAMIGIEHLDRGVPLCSVQSPKRGSIFLKQSTELPANGTACLWLGGDNGKVVLATGPCLYDSVSGPLFGISRASQLTMRPTEGIDLKAGTSTIKVHHERGIELRHGAWFIKIGPTGITLGVAENVFHLGPMSKDEANLAAAKAKMLAESDAKLSKQQMSVSDLDMAPMRMQMP